MFFPLLKSDLLGLRIGDPLSESSSSRIEKSRHAMNRRDAKVEWEE